MKTVRAKFRCASVTQHDPGKAPFAIPEEDVTFHPVMGGSDENKTWSQYTPSGSLHMRITAKGAVGHFKPGKEYYLEITEADTDD